ncbi:MAG: type VI secretion system-associated FHA domain protein TagH [Chitinophagaceae bacterium]|nr:type VI secretion system-associated FHA domain protein TagH [Rubrivivax sp.]
MPTLTLTVLWHPEDGSEQKRHVQGTTLSIGRGAECDWALPDPLKSLSRLHCQLECIGGIWRVRDLSVNGTFINSAVAAIGRDAVQPLVDGDLLRLGDYEIEVRISNDEPLPSVRPDTRDRQPLPFGDVSPRGFGAVRLPGLDDPLPGVMARGPEPAIQSFGAMPDHAAASAQAFVPPSPSASPRPAAQPIVPDDWYRQPDPGLAPAAAPWVSPEPLVPVPQPGAPVSPPVLPSVPAAAPAAGQLSAPVVAVAAVSPSASTPATATGSMASGLAALMAGGELPPEVALRAVADPEAVLRNAGALLRTAVAGIRALLIARGSVKREFRIEQTMLMPRENNLLKFASSDEQALTALLDPRTPSLSAVQDSIQDLTLHQVAVLAATQAAARALLEQLNPTALEAADPGGGLFSDSLEKRLWEAYKRRHAKLIEQFEDDFESAFGKSFARAYEQAVRKDKR